MIGFVLSGRLYKRRDFLKSFTEFISLLATNLRYSGDDIFTLVNSCAENSSLDSFLQNFNIHAVLFQAKNQIYVENIKNDSFSQVVIILENSVFFYPFS